MAVYYAPLLALMMVLIVLTLVWLVQLRTHNAGLVDVFWTLCVGGISVLYAAVGDAPVVLRILLGLFAGFWALRLAGHLALRMRGAVEDRRYTALRNTWGKQASVYLLLFFWFQAFVAWILTLPLLAVAYSGDMPGMGWLGLAAVIWAIALIGEALADYQLARFKRDSAQQSQVMDRGLWRYSRHPNYFFETLHWIAYMPLAVGATYGWVTLTCPCLIAVLLLKVSGIPTIESDKPKTQRLGYADYVRRTSAFIPWPPARPK